MDMFCFHFLWTQAGVVLIITGYTLCAASTWLLLLLPLLPFRGTMMHIRNRVCSNTHLHIHPWAVTKRLTSVARDDVPCLPVHQPGTVKRNEPEMILFIAVDSYHLSVDLRPVLLLLRLLLR